MTVLRIVRRTVFLCILLLPVGVYGRRHLDQPGTILCGLQQVRRGKILRAIGRGVAEGLEQAGMNQRGDVVRLTVQYPSRLLCIEPNGKLPQQRQEPKLIFFHTRSESPSASESEQTENNCPTGTSIATIPGKMDQLIKLVRTYRLTTGLAERTRLAEDIFRAIEPRLRLFVFGAVRLDSAEDVLQEVLKAIVTSLKSFRGES